MTPENNIENLSRDILQQAKSEAEQLLSEAKIKAEEIHKRAQDEADAEKERILAQAKRDSDRIRSQAIATTQLKARTLQLESREILLTEVFSEAMKKLPSVQQWNDFGSIIENLAIEAISQLGSNEVLLHTDSVTAKLMTDSVLKKIRAKFKESIEIGGPLTNGTGLIATTKDGHLTYDNTLETRLQKIANELRSPVYHLLMGESL